MIASQYLSVKEALNRDMDWFRKLPIRIDEDIFTPIILQSIHGRMIFGHGSFYNHRNKDVTFDEICYYAGESPKSIRQKRQERLDKVPFLLEDLLDGKKVKLIDDRGRPIYGISFLDDISIEDNKSALIGAALGGSIDSDYWRMRTINHYGTNLGGHPLRIGGGKERLVDLGRLEELGLTLRDLEKNEHSVKELDFYNENGLFCDDIDNENVTNQFVRYSKGPGVCDDAAILSIGKMYGLDAMIMAFIMDTTDTYGKFVTNPVHGGHDETHAKYVMSEWSKRHKTPLVTDEEIMRVIYLSAKGNIPKMEFSSSHRRFCQHEQDEASGQLSRYPTFVRHAMFLYGESEDIKCRLGFDRFSSRKFYEIFNERISKYEKRFGNPPTPVNYDTNLDSVESLAN